MRELIIKVQMWFRDRNLENAEPSKQMLKLTEELGELASGIARNDVEEQKDAIGDVLVVLIGLGMQLDLDLEECLEFAYNEIKDRTGKVVNGVYIKSEDFKKGEKLK